MKSGVTVHSSVPQPALGPENLRRMARRAGLPELGTTDVVYTCLAAGVASSVVGYIVFKTTT